MAGFFGFFDYTKEGSGISKNAPKKKSFFEFFEIYGRNFWSFTKASFLFLILSIPIFTYGWSSVGLTYITRNASREKHSFLMSDFFETIKKNWKQALIAGVINTIVTALLLTDIYYFYSGLTKSTLAFLGLGFALFMFFCFTAMKYYLWVMIITFELPLSKIYRNCFHFVFLNLGRNILIELTLLFFYILCYLVYSLLAGPGIIVAIVTFIFILPAFKSYLVQANVFPAVQKFIIDPYYAEHPGEDVEKRKALGLELSKEEAAEINEDEPIFNDDTPHKQ